MITYTDVVQEKNSLPMTDKKYILVILVEFSEIGARNIYLNSTLSVIHTDIYVRQMLKIL